MSERLTEIERIRLRQIVAERAATKPNCEPGIISYSIDVGLLLADRADQQAEIQRLVARVGELEGELERFSSGTREHDPNAFYLKTTATNPPAAQALANGEQAR
jgi:hypothetical protein